MTRLSDTDLEDRVRASLVAWGTHAPLGEDRLPELIGARNRRAIAVMAVAAVTLAAMLATSMLYRSDDPEPTVAGPAPTPARIVVGQASGVRVLASDGEDVWLMSSGDRALYRLDADSATVTATIDVDGYYEGLVVRDGVAWLAGYDPNRVVAIDTRTRRQIFEIPLDEPPQGIAAAFGAIWVSGGDHLTKIDPASGRDERIEIGHAIGFFDDGLESLWIAEAEGTAVLEVDPTDGNIDSSIEVGGMVRSVRLGPDGMLWATLPDDDEVVAIDLATRRVRHRLAVGDWPSSIDFVSGDVWVTDLRDGTVTVISPGHNSTRALAAGSVPGSVIAAAGKAWVSLHRESTVLVYDGTQAYPEMPDVTFSTEDDAAPSLYVRCRGAGETTVVLVPDPVYDAGTFASLERELSAEARVCRTVFPEQPARPDVVAADLRRALESPDLAQSFVVVGHGFGGLAARELAATWDRVAALALMDSNTLAPDGDDGDAVIRSLAREFERVDGMRIDAPIVVIASDPDAAPDPRNGPAEARRDFSANQTALADRLGAALVVAEGDPWVPTYRPRAIADAILDLLANVQSN